MVSSGIKTFCKKRAIPIESIDLVGTHISGLGRFGHPEKDTQSFHPLGWNARIAVETGISTVFDFIVMEGGLAKLQTSPVAFVDRLLLSHASKFRACLNIGELTSLSFVLPLTDEDGPKTTMSYDCGPGSLLIDYAMRYCSANIRGQDNNGKFAASGEVNQAIVTRFLLGNNYSRTSPSLRIAREMFGNHEGQRLIDECIYTNLSEPDIAATVTRITAENILTQYQRILNFAFPSGQKIDELFISGPCARNENLIDYLEAELPESVVTKPMDDIGIPGDANEAVCYAHLALETVLERTTRSSSSPGALESDGVRGSIVWGKNWSHVSDRIHRFSNGKSLHLTKNVRVAGSLEPEFRGLSGW
jgi:1,6-anhydro-N-acetylmuramate kinase